MPAGFRRRLVRDDSGSAGQRVTGQLTEGSRGSRVKKCDPLSSLRLVSKTLRNVCHCDSAEIRFVCNSVIIWTPLKN